MCMQKKYTKKLIDKIKDLGKLISELKEYDETDMGFIASQIEDAYEEILEIAIAEKKDIELIVKWAMDYNSSRMDKDPNFEALSNAGIRILEDM